MSAYTHTHGQGPDAKVILNEIFSDPSPTPGTEGLGPLIIRFQPQGASDWIRIIPPGDCPHCQDHPGVNTHQRLCNACSAPARDLYLEKGTHPALRTIKATNTHRGKDTEVDLAIIDLRPIKAKSKKNIAKSISKDEIQDS